MGRNESFVALLSVLEVQVCANISICVALSVSNQREVSDNYELGIRAVLMEPI